MQVIQGHNQKLLLLPPLDSFMRLAMLIESKTQPGMWKPLNFSVKSIVVFCRKTSLEFSSLKFQIVLLHANRAANPFYLTGIYELNKKLVYICGSSPRNISYFWQLPIDSLPKTILDQLYFPHYFSLFFRLQTYEIRFILFDRKGAAPTRKIRRYSPMMSLASFWKQPQKFLNCKDEGHESFN